MPLSAHSSQDPLLSFLDRKKVQKTSGDSIFRRSEFQKSIQKIVDSLDRFLRFLRPIWDSSGLINLLHKEPVLIQRQLLPSPFGNRLHREYPYKRPEFHPKHRYPFCTRLRWFVQEDLIR